MNAVQSSEFVTVAEVARRLRLSRRMVYQLVQCGEIPSVRIGRAVRLRQSAVDEFILANESRGDGIGAAS